MFNQNRNQFPMGQTLLRPGKHVIDGESVEVPAEAGKSHVWYVLPAGGHIIDEVRVHVDAGLPTAPVTGPVEPVIPQPVKTPITATPAPKQPVVNSPAGK
jgi:hypothetical protein